MNFLFFAVNTVFCAVNVAFFAWLGHPLNLGAAVASGLVAVFFAFEVSRS